MSRVIVRLRTLVAILAALALVATAPAAALAGRPHHRHSAKRHSHACHIRQGSKGTDDDSDNHGSPSEGDGCI